MKTKLLVTGIVAVASLGLTALAQDSSMPSTPPPGTQPPTYTPPQQIFQGDEMQLDLFGTGSVNEQILNHISGDRVTRNGRLGAGGGVTYYPLRFFGFGGDAYSENTKHSFIDDASGNLYLRLPFDAIHLAPYAYAGAGYQFDPGETVFGQVGAGLDIRITHNWGLFVDGRFVVPTHNEENFGVGRAGIRLVF
ncbi:MAG TPA: hypothetical protein VGI03_02530 [Verrucomicrobiae bacterium]